MKAAKADAEFGTDAKMRHGLGKSNGRMTLNIREVAGERSMQAVP
jgi:hypothetical protein